MVASPITLIPYARRYQRALMRLVHNEQLLHVHLDWHTIDEWISDPAVPIYLAWFGDELIGAIAASPPLHGAAWLRMAAIDRLVDTGETLEALWSALRDRLVELGTDLVGVLIMQPELRPYVEAFGFAYHEEIVTLGRRGMQVPEPLREDVRIRHTDWREVAQVVAIDHAAFAPLWQLSEASLRMAARMAFSFTVAEMGKRIVGYQITTLHQDGVHLARLATLPDVQGIGVGGVLLGEMLNQAVRRGLISATVNTQGTNDQSQRLYNRYGFELTGLAMPVWTLKLQGDT
ncbi:MAG: GNAT family N-acetyltransferase [Anaerolineae bacterium]|nr:GNAT family N-acetyltransferase [Anaerolineae bacterium]